MKLSQSYIKNYMMTFAIGSLCVASFNFVVDPQKIFAVVDVKGFNHEKPFIMSGGLRKLKSVELEKGNYENVLLGTSRVMRGLNPQNPVFNSRPVYNAGLPGANIYEILKTFEFANNHEHLKTVVVGLDVFSFNSKIKPKADYYESKFSGSYNKFNFIFSELFSIEKFIRSLSTINFNLRNQHDEYIINGFMQKEEAPEYNRRKLFIEKIKSYITLEKLYPGLYDSPEKLELLKEVFNHRKDDTKLYLFISPIHAYQLEGMRSINRFSRFEEWKRDLVKIIAEDAVKNPKKQPIILWDFSGYNSVTTEKISPTGSKKEMKWYWEPSHYKKELGDLVLDVMFNYPNKSKNAPSDFGVVIDSSNIESHLQKIRAEQARYQQNFPEEVEIIERLKRETAHFRGKNNIN
ncbi:MAG: hypothetical protein QNJ49_07670 [Mastigocoleus sp. MO_167.B18]|nr:hypothetical protein [Mastigocoleus sp. MO_167.B18]